MPISELRKSDIIDIFTKYSAKVLSFSIRIEQYELLL